LKQRRGGSEDRSSGTGAKSGFRSARQDDPRRAGAGPKPPRARGTRDADEPRRGPGQPERQRNARQERPAGAAAKPGRPRRENEPRRASGASKPPSRPAEAPRAEAEPPRAHVKGEPQRIAKLLARAGIASRREIERMIEERRIAIDGTPIETPATLLTSLQGVSVDGKPVQAAAPARLFLYHKPPGLLTAERDPAGRPTIYDRLPAELPRVVPVGRLDLNTEGLLLLTTDGGLKRQLELPSSKIERIYRARAFGDVTQDQLEALIEGIEVDGMRYGPIDANMERRTGRNVWIEMRLTEGKNREVRNVLEHLGLQVSRLIRVAYGPFVLGDLPAGAVVEVRQHELVEFRKGLKSPSPSGEGLGVGDVGDQRRPRQRRTGTGPTPTPPLKGRG
jgi:23S rRNA pseudouridine2605 synthase